MAAKELLITLRGKTWCLDDQSLDIKEWMALERATGLHWAQIAAEIDTRSATGITAALWTAMRREQPTLGWSQLNFRPTEITWEARPLGEDAGEEGVDKKADPPASPDSPSDP